MSTTHNPRPGTTTYTRVDTTDLATRSTGDIRKPTRTTRVYPLTNVHRIPNTNPTEPKKKITLDQLMPWFIVTAKIAAVLVALAVVASVIYGLALGVAAIVGWIAAGIAWITKYAVLIGLALLVCWFCSGSSSRDHCRGCRR